MLKIAIIGCGRIADAHLEQIRRIPNCEVVAACDHEIMMAEQLAERYDIPLSLSDVDHLLGRTHPDVVHITTPPQSHYALATKCLEAGVHVYLEKPFTVSATEAHELLDMAKSRSLKITVGHDLQFTHVARRLRALVSAGYLGDSPIHMESYYGYELSGTYASALLSDPNHWVRRLPGGLYQNVISHGLARICEYLPSSDPTVFAYATVSTAMNTDVEYRIIDELRVFVADPTGVTANFVFSAGIRPCLHTFQIFGSRNSLFLDEDQQVLIHLPGRRRKSFLERFISPCSTAGQYVGSAFSNIRLFLKRDFHMKSGLKYLIQAFYDSIINRQDGPIPDREIRLSATIMDRIIQQVHDHATHQPSGSVSRFSASSLAPQMIVPGKATLDSHR